MSYKLNDRALQAQARGAKHWLSDGGARGSGRLVALACTFYFQYFAHADGRW